MDDHDLVIRDEKGTKTKGIILEAWWKENNHPFNISGHKIYHIEALLAE